MEADKVIVEVAPPLRYETPPETAAVDVSSVVEVVKLTEFET